MTHSAQSFSARIKYNLKIKGKIKFSAGKALSYGNHETKENDDVWF